MLLFATTLTPSVKKLRLLPLTRRDAPNRPTFCMSHAALAKFRISLISAARENTTHASEQETIMRNTDAVRIFTFLRVLTDYIGSILLAKQCRTSFQNNWY